MGSKSNDINSQNGYPTNYCGLREENCNIGDFKGFHNDHISTAGYFRI